MVFGLLDCLSERTSFYLLDMECWQIILIYSGTEVLWEYMILTESQLHFPGPLFLWALNFCLLSTMILSKSVFSVLVYFLVWGDFFAYFSTSCSLYIQFKHNIVTQEEAAQIIEFISFWFPFLGLQILKFWLLL